MPCVFFNLFLQTFIITYSLYRINLLNLRQAKLKALLLGAKRIAMYGQSFLLLLNLSVQITIFWAVADITSLEALDFKLREITTAYNTPHQWINLLHTFN